MLNWRHWQIMFNEQFNISCWNGHIGYYEIVPKYLIEGIA